MLFCLRFITHSGLEVGMSGKPQVIVLGLGIAGSSIAATLAERGYEVTAVEQFGPLHERGSSHGDTRIYRRVPHEGAPYVDLATRSLEGWKAWSKLAKDPLLVQCGGIDAGPAESPMVRSAEELCRQYEQPFRTMSGSELNTELPNFNLPADWQVIYQPSSGFVRPDATRTFLHRLATEFGARLLFNTPILGIEPSSKGVLIRTANETLECDHLVVSAGSWLPKLFPELGLSLSPERRVIAWYSPLGQLDPARMPIFCLDAHGGWYGMPTPDGRIKVGNDKHLRQKIDPDQPAAPPGPEDIERISGIWRYLTGFAQTPSEIKTCIYTIAPDQHFIIDRHPSHGNILIFSCCSGHGFKYAPVYGEIAADLLASQPCPGLEMLRISVSRVPATRFEN
jgi:sarcosine oxidase